MLELPTIELDLPALAAAFTRRLYDAGVPVSPERATRFAHGLALVQPISRRRLYFIARAVFVTDPTQLPAFDSVFALVFGSARHENALAPDEIRTTSMPFGEARQPERADNGDAPSADVFASSPSAGREDREPTEVALAMAASDEEVLRGKRFDELDADELTRLYRLIANLRIAAPTRRSRRVRRDRRGERIDMRRTLRGSMRTGGDPIRLARRRRRVVRRRIVMLCDISGSMDAYARVYLQFLSVAAGSGPHAEAFVFATRLTRLTRALGARNPERAIQRAAAAAPDWSSGTRIGDALHVFNSRHGRRGMARGAVIVILSDGWERGDPAVVGKELERLARLAYRIVWVNPRLGASGFSPRAGGMVAALPHCDALVSGHTLEALDEVIEAIAAERSADQAPKLHWDAPEVDRVDEPWGSAIPVKGSSVAMPSGHGPSRGKTTPGW